MNFQLEVIDCYPFPGTSFASNKTFVLSNAFAYSTAFKQELLQSRVAQ